LHAGLEWKKHYAVVLSVFCLVHLAIQAWPNGREFKISPADLLAPLTLPLTLLDLVYFIGKKSFFKLM